MISSYRSRVLMAVLLAVPFSFAASALAQSSGAGPDQGQGPGPNQGQGQGQGQGGWQRGGPRGPMSPDDRLKEMIADLNLTADQQAKIKPILVDQQKKMDDLRNDNSSGGDRQAMRQKFEQIRTDANQKIRAVLDDKQKAKFDQEEQDREQRMQRRGGPGGPGGGPGNGPNNGPNNGPDNGPNNGPNNGPGNPPPTN